MDGWTDAREDDAYLYRCLFKDIGRAVRAVEYPDVYGQFKLALDKQLTVEQRMAGCQRPATFVV